MGKKLLSLCMALALCLGLLPVTALAADEIKLFIGGQQITESGCYANQNGTWTKVEGTGPSSGQFYYDAATFTLTLNQAEITHNQTVNVAEGYTFDGSVIAFSQTADVSLKIVVSQGTSTITGNGGIRVDSKTGNASLSIKGPGSLDVEPKGSNSGITLCSSKNTNLDIVGADVTASSPAQYGVYLISSTDASSTSTITVNNGSLTTGGNGNVGIYYYWSGTSNAGTSSLTVSGNAVVDTRNSQIMAQNKETVVQVGAGSDGNGGIVFNGKSGTVYGDVTLDESLIIGSEETLTIPDDSSLNSNGKLTNNGKIIVDNGGKLEGTINGNQPPKITTTSLSEGTVNAAYSQTLAATGESITWSVASGSTLPGGLNLEKDTITGTPTTAGDSTFIVTATNTNGSDSKEYTLTINPAPVLVTGISLNNSNLSLYTGKTATLTATVTPENATNKAVTWKSSDDTIATVDNNGKVTAVKEGTATITATAADGSGVYATCTVTVNQSTYSISADTTAIDFGSAYTSYTQPAAKTVTITNTGNQTLTLNQPASTVSFEVGTLTKTQLAAGEKATFTVQPKAGLAVGTYSENFTVSGDGGATVTITANFTVQRYSSGGGTPSKTPSQQAIDKIEAAKDGSTVEITLSSGSTKLDKEVFEELAGRDVTLEISVPGGITWTVNGQDIPKNAKLSDLDLGVSLNTSTIPVSVINTITGTVDTIQLSLKHDGEFGFTMTLSAPLGKTNAGYWANLYYYNTRTRTLEFQSASKIATDGTASFPFSHASDYAIVIDTDSHEPVELPFTDVPEDAWYEDAAGYVYKHGLMAGTSATTFAPDVTTSRAMIATILWRMAGSPVVNYAMTYTDVAQGQWYSEAVRWATSEGVVTGYGNGLFGTNDPITREQFATMLWRYAQTEGYDVSIGEDTNIPSYTDVADLSEYAIPAMQWACGAGVINGTGDGSTLSPQGQATRAQAAVMLMRFCEYYVTW